MVVLTCPLSNGFRPSEGRNSQLFISSTHLVESWRAVEVGKQKFRPAWSYLSPFWLYSKNLSLVAVEMTSSKRHKGNSGDDRKRGDDIVTKFPPGRSWKIGGYGWHGGETWRSLKLSPSRCNECEEGGYYKVWCAYKVYKVYKIYKVYNLYKVYKV